MAVTHGGIIREGRKEGEAAGGGRKTILASVSVSVSVSVSIGLIAECDEPRNSQVWI